MSSPIAMTSLVILFDFFEIGVAEDAVAG